MSTQEAELFWRDVMETDEADLFAFAVFGDFEEIEDAEKAGFAGQGRGNVGQADRLDGVNFDVAFFHDITLADGDAWAHPEADGGGDFTALYAGAKAPGEGHGVSVARHH